MPEKKTTLVLLSLGINPPSGKNHPVIISPQELMKKTRVTDYGHTRFLSFQSRSMRLSRIPLKGARTEGI